MKLLYPRCGVLIMQGQRVLACVRIQDADGPAHDEVRTFAILPAELVTLSDWLAAHGVTHVAVESTKQASQPLLRALQQAFTVLQIAVLVIDETGFLNKGRHLAGVARQYSILAGSP